MLRCSPSPSCTAKGLRDQTNGAFFGRVAKAPHVYNAATLCALYSDFQPVLSPSCCAKDSRSGEGLQVCLDRRCLRIQLVSISPVPRARWCGQKEVLDQFTVRTSCSVTKPAEPSLHEPCRQTCKAEVVSQFHRLGQVRCSLSDWNLLRRMASKNCRDYNLDTRLSGTLSNSRCVLIEE